MKTIKLSFYQVNKSNVNEYTFERSFIIESETDLNIKKALHKIAEKITNFAFDMLLLKQDKPTLSLGFKLTKPLFIACEVDGKKTIDTIQAESLKISVRAKSGEHLTSHKLIYRMLDVIVRNMQDKIEASEVCEVAKV